MRHAYGGRPPKQCISSFGEGGGGHSRRLLSGCATSEAYFDVLQRTRHSGKIDKTGLVVRMRLISRLRRKLANPRCLSLVCSAPHHWTRTFRTSAFFMPNPLLPFPTFVWPPDPSAKHAILLNPFGASCSLGTTGPLS